MRPPHLRQTVTATAKTRASALEQLAADRSLDVRRAVVHHPRIHRALAQRLSGDPDADVCAAAKAKLTTPHDRPPGVTAAQVPGGA